MSTSILKDPLQFPDDASTRCSEAGISALRGFLDRDPGTRLGCRPNGEGLKELQRHPWFADVRWESLSNKESQPPFVPDMKQANFDVTHELDEFLMVEKPLTHSKRKTNTDLDKLKPELRQLEEQFTVYDFSRSQRLSYYPHNEPVTSLGADAENSSQSTTNTLIPGATVTERSQAGSPVLSDSDHPHQRAYQHNVHSRTPSHGRGRR